MNPPAAPPLFAPLFEGPTDVFDYSSVFSVLPLPAILIDSRGTIVDVNDAYLAAATKTEESASADALIGRPVWDVAPDDDDPILPKAMVEQALASEADDLEMPSPLLSGTESKEGTLVLHEVRVILLPERAGAIIVREEITERVAQAERLQVPSICP